MSILSIGYSGSVLGRACYISFSTSSFRMALRIYHSGAGLALPSKNSCSCGLGPGPIGYSILERLIRALTFLTRFIPAYSKRSPELRAVSFLPRRRLPTPIAARGGSAPFGDLRPRHAQRKGSFHGKDRFKASNNSPTLAALFARSGGTESTDCPGEGQPILPGLCQLAGPAGARGTRTHRQQTDCSGRHL